MRRFGSLATGLFAMVEIAACGDDTVHHLADAPPTDPDVAPIDAVDAPPAAEGITVTTYTRSFDGQIAGAIQANVPIVVVNPDLTEGQTAMTGAAGTVVLENVLPGSSITAIYPKADNTVVVATFAAVKPGDHLSFGDNYFTSSTGGTTANVTFNWAAPVANAARFEVESYGSYLSSADGTLTSLALTITATHQKATLPVVLRAFDATGTRIATGYLPAANTTDGAMNDVTWVAEPTAPNVQVELTALDPAITNAYADATKVYAPTTLGGIGDASYSSIALENHAGTVGLTVAGNTAPTFVRTQIYRDDGYFAHETYLRPAGATVALTADPVPYLGQVNFGSQAMSWTVTAGTSDTMVLEADWFATDASSTHYYWTLIAPPPAAVEGTATFDWSTFPDSVKAVLPAVNQNICGDVNYIDLNAAGYDAARQQPEWIFLQPHDAVRDGDVPEIVYADGGEGCGGGPVTRTSHRERRPHAPPRPAPVAPHWWQL